MLPSPSQINPVSSSKRPSGTRRLRRASIALVLTLTAVDASAFSGVQLSDQQGQVLDQAWQADAKGRISNRCGKTRFCGAFRDDRAQPLADQGMYVGSIFASDLYDWDRIGDHHDLVRGYVLEKFFTDTHPESQLAQLKAYGGLSGAKYEARDMPKFFEQYLLLHGYQDSRHFILAFELQKRYFVRNNWGKIIDVRNMASRIQSYDPKFKPLRDATHNQASASLIPRLTRP